MVRTTYGRRMPASSRPDGSDPKLFVETLLGRLGVSLATLSAEKRAGFFDNDFHALAAAQQDRPSLEDILRTMMMPCLLYSGEADGIFPQVQECFQQIPSATMVSYPQSQSSRGVPPRGRGRGAPWKSISP